MVKTVIRRRNFVSCTLKHQTKRQRVRSFIASNLALGVTFSTVSANQMQAVQLAQFTLMPSFMLSGFMFPFRGMPIWAQALGNVFPTTHAMRIVRGVLLKGVGWAEIAPELWPMALFTVAIIAFATLVYRETLD